MIWAEVCLASLGFETRIEKNVKSYISESDNFVVYADPRASGGIEFRAYMKRPARNEPTYRSFMLKDNWKNDILGKYECRLTQATSGRQDS